MIEIQTVGGSAVGIPNIAPAPVIRDGRATRSREMASICNDAPRNRFYTPAGEICSEGGEIASSKSGVATTRDYKIPFQFTFADGCSAEKMSLEAEPRIECLHRGRHGDSLERRGGHESFTSSFIDERFTGGIQKDETDLRRREARSILYLP